ncbi:MAG: hypothetical protein IJ064_05425 [Bacteroidaceae bacterium]|nr:hypothetical protein [Bacteroidaceae bacterium]
MAKITNLSEQWDGKHTGDEIEEFLKEKLGEHETAIDQSVKGVTVNGSPASVDANGRAQIIVPTIDSSLNTESSNAVENGVVATEINGLKNAKVGGMRTEDAGDGASLNLIIENENGDEVASCRIPKASEGGDTTYARVTAALSKTRIKQGDSVVLTWTYNHLNGDGTPTGTAAEQIIIRVVSGTTETYRETLSNIADNTTRNLTLTADMLPAGTVGVYVQAIVKNEDGTEQKAQGYKSVQVVAINLDSSFDPASQLSLTDGFTDSQTIDIPFTITGPRGSSVTLWLDGQQRDTTTINTSSTTMGHFYIPASSLAPGSHNIQMVAESDGLLSNVVYCDFRKAGNTTPYLGVKMALDADSMSDLPLGSSGNVSVNVEQFSNLSLNFAAWNPDSVTSIVSVAVDGATIQTLSADRSMQTLTQRFDNGGTSTLTLHLGSVTKSMSVVVSAAEGIDEQETSDYVLKLTATGRSNSESNPADWGGVVSFSGVNWSTNGWGKHEGVDCLLLTNGASATIHEKPFVLTNDYSVERNGLTVEMEVMVSQVLERGARIVSCLDGNPALGFDITTEEAGLHLGQMQNIQTAEKDENGNTIVISRELGVAMNIATEKWMKVAFVVQPSTGGRKTFLFINGVISKANQYDAGLSLVQDTPQGITINSDKADVRVRSVRIYHRALTRNELLGNWIVDGKDAAEIKARHDKNVTSSEGSAYVIDPNVLIEHNGGVLVIIRSDDSGTGLTDVYDKNDKKADFIADYIHWYSPLGRAYDFEAYNVYIRIQGTSSTKYPWKNIRIYLTKGPFTAAKPCKIIYGGVTYEQSYNAAKDKWQLLSADGKEFKGYALRGSGNSIEQAVLCAKTDFVDSSLVLNTGGAILYDNTMRSLDLLTPPQKYDSRVRQAIDGIPCDIFCGTSLNGTLTYYGQYNLNNEKSKSGKIFGMEGVKDSDGKDVSWPCAIALEALDNGSPMTLFQSAGSAGSTALENQLEAEFDGGFEFNFPEDTFWSSKKITDPKKESIASDTQKQAIRRLMGWLYDVTPAAMRTNPDYGTKDGWSEASMAKWKSARFKDEANQYFNVNHLLAYYLFTDYHASVDQRAKNILWRTWDGLIWYSTYYDGDTAHSLRNDAFMAYLYNITRDTWDDERSKYAFEGHNSRLWCLVLANMEDELREMATKLRGVMTLAYMLQVFNEDIMGNWSERQYNESQMLKYVDTMEKQNYVYTLTGNREAHRTAFLTDRSQLLDARYATGNYQADYVGIRVGREATDAQDLVTLKSGDLYYFGWKLSNGSWRYGPVRAQMGDSVTLPITGKLSSANDPLAICGASRMTELDFTGMNGHIMGDLDLSRCTMLSKLLMAAKDGKVNNGVIMSLGSISKLEHIDLTGQTSTGTNQAGTALDVSGQSRLHTLMVGGTGLQIVTLPEGAPLEKVVLPAATTRLSLRYLPNLYRSGLTLEGTANVRQFLFAECPNLNWQELLAECPNVEYVRIEGVSGKVRADFLEKYADKKGYDADGTPVTFPALTGKVILSEVISDERLAALRNTFKYLDIVECQFSQYTFHDEETDPANITNEDNQTGYKYRKDGEEYDGTHPNGYYASGHVALIRDRSHVVSGLINPKTGKMHCTKISRTSLTLTADGVAFNPADPNGEMYDVFLYLPKYFYKGVNDYKNAQKHLFLSSRIKTPDSTATITRRLTLADLLYQDGKVIDNRLTEEGDSLEDTTLSTATNCNLYRVDVSGMKQVRFPGLAHSYFSSAFVDEGGKVIQLFNLTMQDIVVNGAIVNPADFDNEIGDYDFRTIPDGAKYLYFACMKTSAATLPEVIVTDSAEVEAIEPDWVEHKSELIGIYQGWAEGMSGASGGIATSGLRSISGKGVIRGNGTSTTNANWLYDADGNPTALPTTKLNGTAQDFFNLASVRNALQNVVNGEYGDIPYETSKDMANLIMAWFGTRDVETIVGRGSSAGETSGVRNAIPFGDSAYYAQNQHNKMWCLECWTASTYEWTDKGCFNAPSFARFKKEKRPDSTSYAIDYHYNILQQDGNERRVKAATLNAATCAARVRFGRYCDIVVSSYTGETTYAMCYAAYQSSNGSRGRVLGRSSSVANANAGVAYSFTYYASSYSYTYYGGRLCFFGEIENEDELTEAA